jgi:hypothetical protein
MSIAFYQSTYSVASQKVSGFVCRLCLPALFTGFVCRLWLPALFPGSFFPVFGQFCLNLPSSIGLGTFPACYFVESPKPKRLNCILFIGDSRRLKEGSSSTPILDVCREKVEYGLARAPALGTAGNAGLKVLKAGFVCMPSEKADGKRGR